MNVIMVHGILKNGERMVYDKKASWGDNQWHCPFPPEWVERMKRTVKVCKDISAEYIEGALNREAVRYIVPPGDFLSQPQDARGIPLGYGEHAGLPVTCDIYDYCTIPDVVVTNGREDWPLTPRFKKLQA